MNIDYTSKRAFKECGSGPFNGNQQEFFREIVYRTALELSISGVCIQHQIIHLQYDLSSRRGYCKI